MAQTCGNIVVHIIFSTKGRVPLITPEIRTDLLAYLGGIIRELRGTALIINGTGDHVHVLARIRPIHSPAEIARVIKTNSSRLASANQMLHPSPDTSQTKKHIIGNVRSRKSS